MPVNTEALTTLDRVSEALLRSTPKDALSEKVFNSSGAFSDEGIRSVHYASDRVKSYLKRDLFIGDNKVYLTEDDWKPKERSPSDYEYKLALNRIGEWPIVKVDEDVTIVSERGVFAKDKSLNEINYFAGYRRKDQTDTNSLTTSVDNEFNSVDDIPVLPDDIEDVVIHIAIYKATLRLKELIGTERSEQEFGDFATTIRKESYEADYENSQLNNIQSRRFLV